MRPRRGFTGQEGAIPFVLVGVVALGGVLGAAWAGQEWSQRLLGEAGGELTVWVLRGAFWALDLVALQASMEPVEADWYTPVLEGPALPLYVLAALVMVATLLGEVIAGMVQGNTTRIVQAVFRALLAGMLATVGASLLLAVGGGLSEIGRLALDASGTSVDAPLIPLQEVLMDTAEQRGDAGVELFIAFLAGLVIVLTSLSIYFLLAMRPVVLAAIIVFLPVAHALSVFAPLRRVQLRVWSLAFAVLLADAAILTMFAVANTAMGQPEGIDRLIFGTFGLLLAALAPAALARIVGAPELHTAVQSVSRGSKALAIGAGIAGLKGGRASLAHAAAGQRGPSALEGPGPDGGPGPGGSSAGGSGPSGGPAAGGVGPDAGGAGAPGSGGGRSGPGGQAEAGNSSNSGVLAGVTGSGGRPNAADGSSTAAHASAGTGAGSRAGTADGSSAEVLAGRTADSGGRVGTAASGPAAATVIGGAAPGAGPTNATGSPASHGPSPTSRGGQPDDRAGAGSGSVDAARSAEPPRIPSGAGTTPAIAAGNAATSGGPGPHATPTPVPPPDAAASSERGADGGQVPEGRAAGWRSALVGAGR